MTTAAQLRADVSVAGADRSSRREPEADPSLDDEWLAGRCWQWRQRRLPTTEVVLVPA